MTMCRGLPATLLGLVLPTMAAATSLETPTVTYPTLPAQVEQLQDAVPSGWKQIALEREDLNGDGRADAALLLRDADPALKITQDGFSFDTNPYLLAVYFADSDGGYRNILANHHLIPRRDSIEVEDVIDGVQGGGIAIVHGTLQVSLGLFSGISSGMNNRSLTFRWRKGDHLHKGRFLLIGFDSLEVNRADGSMVSDSYNYLTAKQKHGIGSIENDATRYSWLDLPQHRLVGLNELGNGSDFDPEAPPPFPADAWNWADEDGGGNENKPAYRESKALCAQLRDLRPPASQISGLYNSAPSPGRCESTALYYGIGVPSDPEKAHACAFYEIGDPDMGDDPFTGFGMLMMIYANGKGAPRDLDLATAMACRVPAGSSYEVVERIQHLQALKATLAHRSDSASHSDGIGTDLLPPSLVNPDPSKPFDFCDDAISNFGTAQCASLQAQIDNVRKDDDLDEMTATWPKERKAAFARLRQAVDSFAEASSQNEVDLTGSGRALFIIQRAQEVQTKFVALHKAYQAGTLPDADAAGAQKADAALNRVYQRIMATTISADDIRSWQTADSLPLVSITHAGIRQAQRAWLAYRDSWKAFADGYDPHHRKDALLTALTKQRTAFLKETLGSDE